jgi:two-component sensor histidine kinase
MVLTELLQNALQHGFPHASREPGFLEVHVVREPERLTVTVADSGVGLPPDFDLDSASGLGLQIVRTLVEGDLAGRLRITPRPGGGSEAVMEFPIGEESPAGSVDDPSART